MSLTRLKPTGVNATAQFSMANLAVSGNVSANIVKTDHISHADGTSWDFVTYPAGSDTQIAFNNAGVFGANANLTFNKTTKTLATDNVTAKVFTGNIATAVQSNITSVGTLTGLTVSGDASLGANLTITGNLTVSGTTTTINSTTVTVNDLAVVLANNASTMSAANGAGIIINGASANILYNSTSNSFTFTHPISANGALLTSITAANVSGRVALANIANTVSASSQPAITSVGTLTGLVSSGEIVSAIVTTGSISGTLTTAAQTNITSVGTLTDLAVTGNITASKLTVTTLGGTLNAASNSQPNITTVGTLTSTTFAANANIALSGASSQVSGANLVSANFFHGTLDTASNAQPNITSVGTLVSANVSGNIVGNTKLFIGTGSSTLTNPVAVFQGSGATFDQIALFNSVGTGSSDYVAYGDLGNDSQAWTDMGFAGSTFNDANYTVTAPGDGYLFVQGNSSFGGNLVLATGDVGTTHDIIFATGGFKLANIKARLYHANSSFSVFGNVYGANLVSAGQIQSNVTTGTSPFILSSTTKVANLNADLLDGYNTDTAATANTVVVRDTNANITANNITGTLTTSAQTNITSVGTLTNVTVSGNANVANLSANTSVSFTGNTNISAWLSSAQSTEVVNSLGAVAASTVNYNMTTGATFYHSSVTLGANWTVNVQNVPTTDGRSVVLTIMVVQGSTPYIPSALQIDGTLQTIKWSNGNAPLGRVNAVDIFSFGLIRAGAAWAQILGSYTSYS